LALIATPTSSAATKVGSDCLATGSAENFTLVQMGKAPGSPLPTAVPMGGVVTEWKVESGLASVFAEALRVFRPSGNPNELKTLAQSGTEAIVPGTNVFATRIPVRAGDLVGAFAASPSGVLYCPTGTAADVMGAVHFDAAVGSTTTYTPNPGFQLALSATVEPDRDSDGYGDETQDKCPRGAAFQGKCPRVRLRAVPTVRKHSILVSVHVSSRALVKVFGQVNWGVRQKPGRSGAGSPRTIGLTVGLTGGMKTVLPSKTASFRIPLPKPVRRRLGRLTPAESLRAKITVRATDLAGRVTDRRMTVRLAGQGAS
jgi:hypothetical protein